MTEDANGKGSPGTPKGTESDGPKKTIREWGKALLPYAALLVAFATPVALVSNCQLNRLDALRDDVDGDTAKIREDVKKISKEVHENATNIAVLNKQMETVGKTVDKMDEKLDRILGLPARKTRQSVPVGVPGIRAIPVGTSSPNKK